MRKITEVLRLKAAGISIRDIALSVGVGRTTVFEYLARAEAAGLAWPLPESLDEAALEAKLFPPPCGELAARRRVPEWGEVHRELKRGRHVTLRQGVGPRVDAYRQDLPVLESDLAEAGASRWVAFTTRAIEAGARAVFGFPLRVGAVSIGALNLPSDSRTAALGPLRGSAQDPEGDSRSPEDDSASRTSDLASALVTLALRSALRRSPAAC